jgi:nucleoside-triphosphatase THEP1
MAKQEIITTKSLIYYRLIALWVLAEAMLGGIIHGFKLPVSGLVVGSSAVVCICLIAWYNPKKGSIIKATIIVAIFKMMLSPQAPPPAYVAVFFQGLLGELLFWRRRLFQLSCLLLAVLSLLESGLQRILLLTIVYGSEFWVVVNEFFNRLTKQSKPTNYSLLLGAGYVLLHLVVGLIVGLIAAMLPRRIERWSRDDRNRLIGGHMTPATFPVRSRKKKKFKRGAFIIWILLIIIYAQSKLEIGTPLMPSHISLEILIRSVIIILTYVLFLSPLLKRVLHAWLKKRKAKSQHDVQRVLQLLPSTMQLIAQSWKEAGDMKDQSKRGRVIDTTKKIFVNAVYSADAKPVWILTGMIRSGKTTTLVNWSEGHTDVAGVLTPVVNEKRMLMNVKTREQWPMEAAEGEKEVIEVGRFVFSKVNFDKAVELVRAGINSSAWLIIDEIGPMELRGEGFHDILNEVLEQQQTGQTLVLVVREGMVEKVKEKFGLQEATVVKKDSFKATW